MSSFISEFHQALSKLSLNGCLTQGWGGDWAAEAREGDIQQWGSTWPRPHSVFIKTHELSKWHTHYRKLSGVFSLAGRSQEVRRGWKCGAAQWGQWEGAVYRSGKGPYTAVGRQCILQALSLREGSAKQGKLRPCL